MIKGGFSFRVKRELGSNAEIWQEGFTEHRVKNAEDFERIRSISVRIRCERVLLRMRPRIHTDQQRAKSRWIQRHQG